MSIMEVTDYCNCFVCAQCKKAAAKVIVAPGQDGSYCFGIQCSNGHMTQFEMNHPGRIISQTLHTASAEASAEPVSNVGFVNTRVAGVSHVNADGVNRQELLKVVKAGEPLNIMKTPVKVDGFSKTYYGVVHRIGQLGTIDSQGAEEFRRKFPGADIRNASIVVTKIIGGQEGKSYGCLIRMTPCEKDESPVTTKIHSSCEDDFFVFWSPEGTNTFHATPNCSGIRNAKMIPRQQAIHGMGATPCKRCGK